MQELPLTTESLNPIPEEARKFYQLADGKYTLNSTELFAALSAKEKALSSERKIRSDFENRYNTTIKEYEGFDKEEYHQLRNKQKEWESEKEAKEREVLESKGKYEEALEKTRTTYTKELTTLKTDLQQKIYTLNQQLNKSENDKRDYILNDKIRSAILKAGVFTEDIDDVLTLTKHHFQLDDQLHITLHDASGHPTSETMDHFFGETFKKLKPKFYKGSNTSGSGAVTTTATATGHLSPQQLSSIEKIAKGLSQRKG